MSRLLEDASTGARVMLAAVLAATLAAVLPSLLVTGADASGPAALAALMLALAAVCRSGPGRTILAGRLSLAVPGLTAEAPPLLPGRVTDPVHHPLRPRAPGPA